jgi:hypothetical protein
MVSKLFSAAVLGIPKVIKADKASFVGPERVIGSASITTDDGVMRKMPDGNYYIAFSEDKNTSILKMLETLSHEMGHVHEREAFNNAPKEVKDADAEKE